MWFVSVGGWRLWRSGLWFPPQVSWLLSSGWWSPGACGFCLISLYNTQTFETEHNFHADVFIPARMGFIYPPHVQTRVIIFMCWVFVDTLTCVVHMTRALCFRCSSPSTSQPYCITTSAPAGQTLASSRQPRRRRRRYDSGCDWLAWCRCLID